MSTAIQPALPAQQQPPGQPLSPAIMEQVLVQGDLAKLNQADRLKWYIARCESVGLDPRSQPFQYITLQGKLTLYATKACAEQLRKLNGVSVTDVRTQQVGDVYVCTVQVRDRQGREDASTGAVPIQGLRGEALANALMKAETKAKRRATLSICGLGMLDESELDTIPDARPEQARPGIPAGGSPATDKAFREWVEVTVGEANTRFAADLEDIGDEPREIINGWQLRGHLHKWALAEGLYPDDREWNYNHRERALSALFAADPKRVRAECRSYLKGLYDKQMGDSAEDAIDATEVVVNGEVIGREPGEEG